MRDLQSSGGRTSCDSVFVSFCYGMLCQEYCRPAASCQGQDRWDRMPGDILQGLRA